IRQHAADLRGRMVEIAGELDFLESRPGDQRERCGHVFGHQVAYGVELQSERPHAVGMRLPSCTVGLRAALACRGGTPPAVAGRLFARARGRERRDGEEEAASVHQSFACSWLCDRLAWVSLTAV